MNEGRFQRISRGSASISQGSKHVFPTSFGRAVLRFNDLNTSQHCSAESERFQCVIGHRNKLNVCSPHARPLNHAILHRSEAVQDALLKGEQTKKVTSSSEQHHHLRNRNLGPWAAVSLSNNGRCVQVFLKSLFCRKTACHVQGFCHETEEAELRSRPSTSARDRFPSSVLAGNGASVEALNSSKLRSDKISRNSPLCAATPESDVKTLLPVISSSTSLSLC